MKHPRRAQKGPINHGDPVHVRGSIERMAERARRVFQLRIAGLTYRDIGKRVGRSYVTCYRDVQATVKVLHQEDLADARKLKAIEHRRLEEQTRALWARRRDPDVARTLVRIAERRARLCGLDAPIEVTDPNRGPDPLRKVSTALIEQLADALDRP